ncbi:hypothetical protein H920_18027 [Fukomys damarensis]|uniref:Uncharacterized protein n=1 Tax=Fukomys damarensis TaxID=885580 RepID=A0A091CQW5_FUKDA|nr:hypothetical protein H920_18027 [Fukomys damarensis]
MSAAGNDAALPADRTLITSYVAVACLRSYSRRGLSSFLLGHRDGSGDGDAMLRPGTQTSPSATRARRAAQRKVSSLGQPVVRPSSPESVPEQEALAPLAPLGTAKPLRDPEQAASSGALVSLLYESLPLCPADPETRVCQGQMHRRNAAGKGSKSGTGQQPTRVCHLLFGPGESSGHPDAGCNFGSQRKLPEMSQRRGQGDCSHSGETKTSTTQ